MAEGIRTNLEVHATLVGIAQKAVDQVRANPVAGTLVLPGDPPPALVPDPPVYR